jgi:hypothetical protein
MEHRDSLDRVLLVSQRFTELQGLAVAAAGMLFTLTFGAYLVARPAPGRSIWIALAIAFLLSWPLTHLIRRYYATTLGRVSPKAYRLPLVQLGAMAVTMGVIDQALAVPAPANALPIAAAGALWIAIRDWPFRSYHLAGCLVAAAAFALQIVPNTGLSSDVALAVGFLMVGLVYVPIGLLDHRLLVSSMRTHAGAHRHTPGRRQ